MVKKRKLLIILGSMCLCYIGLNCTGCGLLYYLNETSRHKEYRKIGYELCHLQSCGPEALYDAFNKLGIHKESQNYIGMELQDRAKVDYRCILGLAHHRFTLITCPPELRRYCKENNVKITYLDKYEDLQDGDVAIILLKDTSDFRNWHWICWPTRESRVLNFFNENTVIVSIYKLSIIE